MRERMESELSQEVSRGRNPKTGHGGLVDVEFAAQFLQLVHGHDHPEIRTGSTPEALARLRAAGLLREQAYQALWPAATQFLRRVELRLRIVHDYEVDHLPPPGPALDQLARRLGYGGPEAAARFLAEYDRITSRGAARLRGGGGVSGSGEEQLDARRRRSALRGGRGGAGPLGGELRRPGSPSRTRRPCATPSTWRGWAWSARPTAPTWTSPGRSSPSARRCCDALPASSTSQGRARPRGGGPRRGGAPARGPWPVPGAGAGGRGREADGGGPRPGGLREGAGGGLRRRRRGGLELPGRLPAAGAVRPGAAPAGRHQHGRGPGAVPGPPAPLARRGRRPGPVPALVPDPVPLPAGRVALRPARPPCASTCGRPSASTCAAPTATP